jgi:hypothetical protein
MFVSERKKTIVKCTSAFLVMIFRKISVIVTVLYNCAFVLNNRPAIFICILIGLFIELLLSVYLSF